jgi:hypothetical protein
MNGRGFAAVGALAPIAALAVCAHATGAPLRAIQASCWSQGKAPGCRHGRGIGNAETIAASRDGRSIYVGSGLSSVAILRRSSSGALTQPRGQGACVEEPSSQNISSVRRDGCAQVRGLATYSNAAAVSPDGRSVYVASGGGPDSVAEQGGVASFQRDSATGALHQLDGSGGCLTDDGRDGCATARGIVGADAVAVSADGRSVFVASVGPSGSQAAGAVASFERNPQTGALTQPAGPAGCLGGTPADGCAPAMIANPTVIRTLPRSDGVILAATSPGVAGVVPAGGGVMLVAGRSPCDAATATCDAAPTSLDLSPSGRRAIVATVADGALSVKALQVDPSLGQVQSLPGSRVIHGAKGTFGGVAGEVDRGRRLLIAQSADGAPILLQLFPMVNGNPGAAPLAACRRPECGVPKGTRGNTIGGIATPPNGRTAYYTHVSSADTGTVVGVRVR